jgi:hypothetical protein
MKTRLDSVKLTGTAGLASVTANRAVSPKATATATSGTNDRAYWCSIAAKLATPVLAALAERRLKAVRSNASGSLNRYNGIC